MSINLFRINAQKCSRDLIQMQVALAHWPTVRQALQAAAVLPHNVLAHMCRCLPGPAHVHIQMRHMQDTSNSLWYWNVTRNGSRPVQRNKVIQGQWHVLFAFR
jgi:hypothetical protein